MMFALWMNLAFTALSAMGGAGVWLRVIQINDVYELDCFPHFKALVDEKKRGPADRTLVVCAGDFLSPSLLSSLDKGSSMVGCLNAVGCTHVCLGNHEADVSSDQLVQRILQSRFQWINSNLQDLNNRLDIETPEYEILTVESKRDPSVKKKVALLGLLTTDPALYRPGRFAECTMEPVVDAAVRLVDKLRKNCDLILPMIHQSITEDKELCRKLPAGFCPLILGGHEHEPFDAVESGTRIIKTGMDAQNAAVIDIRWEDSKTEPSINVDLLKTTDFPPDPDILESVRSHQQILRELEQAKLFRIQDWLHCGGSHKAVANDRKLVFSTCNNRLRPSTGTTALCTMLRMGMRCQCGLINAGSIRANKEYSDSDYFTWSDLKAEMPFDTSMTATYIPGRVLETTIAHSRAGSRQDPPISAGGYIHGCSNIEFDDETQKIITIRGQPFDPDELYLTALPLHFFRGIDNHKPLLDWAKVNCEVHDDESAIPAKQVLVEVFSALLWLQLGSFEKIDRNKDGVLHKDEVHERVKHVFGMDSVADLVVDSIFSVADMSNDGTITPLEMMVTQYVATDMIDHVCSKEELKVLKDVALEVLGDFPSEDQVHRMVELVRDIIDLAGDGKIHRDEVMKALGRLKKKELSLLQ
jgi:2',3'-cyclic-nucleotide 2'-phosphodiesterase (5'-nucleotidase family)/Ca2+-binding EF-hand superfamily protein